MTDEPITEIPSPQMAALIGESAARVAALVAAARAGGKVALKDANIVEVIAALVVLRVQDEEQGVGSTTTVYLDDPAPAVGEEIPQ